ncbi:MAG: HAMP domain-containing histidine kinase [Acidisphaera sp.]|nr:HAMP domain-containing histidine kinase [Acidisphaera sp.]
MRPIARRRSLTARLIWLTVGVVLLAEILIFVPSLAHERRLWLGQHVREAHIAALAVAAAPGGMVDTQTRDELLRLSGAEMIRLEEPSGTVLALPPPAPIAPEATIDLGQESSLTGLRRALSALFRAHDRQLRIIGPSPMRPSTVVELIVQERGLLRLLHGFAWSIAGLSLLIAGSIGALLYLAMHTLLLRPMRRIIDSIAAFRADPERETAVDRGDIGALGNDEMATAGRELADMQRELRAALWRNARLAALGTAVAKMSHDLRGILSPALLAADRLTRNADPSVRRAGEVLVRVVDRATGIVEHTLEYAREGRPLLARARFPLRGLIEEAAEEISAGRRLTVRDDVEPGLQVEADRTQLFRVVTNLLRNAGEAGARNARISATTAGGVLTILLEDDGPGLPDTVRANLFRPFVGSYRRGGSGLGLAIARDLMRAHGGDVELAATGPGGTAFRLTLPDSDVEPRPSLAAAREEG